MGNSLYRPPQWAQGLGVQTVGVVFPGVPNASQYRSEGITATLPSSQTLYVFDATPRIDHEQRVTKTVHPVQTGASISDHAYLEPARLTLEVAMSDAQDAYAADLWVGGPTKSASAYQVLLAMAFARVLLVVTTKLRTYQNMLIVNNPAEDTIETFAGLKARVTFEEVFLADTQAVVASARPQDTSQTQAGTLSPTPPTQAQLNANVVSNAMAKQLGIPTNVPGAGQWSSVNVNNLPNLFGGH